MPSLKLTYFDFPGGRGEDCRLALTIAGVPFEDERLDGRRWAERKSHTPFGTLPVLEVEGRGLIGQSNAILRYLGEAHDLWPRDPFTGAQHAAIMDAVEELRGQVEPVLRIKDPEERKTAREALVASYLRPWGAHIEPLIAGPFIAGDRLHVADIKLYGVVKWMTGGVVDHVPTSLFNDCPRLLGVRDAVKAHPSVQAWYAR